MIRRFAAPYSAVDDTRARVRPVDDAMASGRQKCGHERLAVREDRPVVRRGAVTLPRRRVEHDDAVIGRVRKSPGVVVGLRPPDLDRAVVEVVVPQHPAEPFTSGSTRDERVVVRLVLVRGHVHLVGLAVVDEHVPSAPVPEHLEVARVLVDVQHHADVLLGDEALEIAHGRHERDRRRVFGQESACTGGDTAQDHDGPGLSPARRAACTTGGSGTCSRRRRRSTRPRGSGAEGAAAAPRSCGGLRRRPSGCRPPCAAAPRPSSHPRRYPRPQDTDGPHDMIDGCMSTNRDARMRRSSPKAPG